MRPRLAVVKEGRDVADCTNLESRRAAATLGKGAPKRDFRAFVLGCASGASLFDLTAPLTTIGDPTTPEGDVLSIALAGAPRSPASKSLDEPEARGPLDRDADDVSGSFLSLGSGGSTPPLLPGMIPERDPCEETISGSLKRSTIGCLASGRLWECCSFDLPSYW